MSDQTNAPPTRGALEALLACITERDEARAEVERLKAENARVWEGAERAIQRLRAALAVYADEEYYNFADNYGWRATHEPWLPAREALSGETAAACQPPPSGPAGQSDSLTEGEFADG